jgi:hypothetical protein
MSKDTVPLESGRASFDRLAPARHRARACAIRIVSGQASNDDYALFRRPDMER